MAGGITLARWSDLLIEEIFEDRDGEGRPVTTIDAGGALLVRALARSGLDLNESAALELFLGAFPPRWQMLRWFSRVDQPREGLAAFLILCCVAASEATGSESNDYRERIREMMGWDAIAMDCGALPGLWKRLARALATAPPENRLRPLTLPDPRFRSQIGHAIELTFPSRQDARRLRHDLDEGGLTDLRSPVAVLRWVSARLERFSPAFQQTFEDFAAQWRAGARALTDHRFWSGWRTVVDAWRPQSSQEPFFVICDEWGRHQIVTPSGDPTTLREIERSGPAPVRQLLASGSPVFLEEIDWGEWGWVGQGRAAGREARAALAREKSHNATLLAQLDRAPVIGAEGWFFTNAVDVLPGRASRLPISDDELIEIRFHGVPRIEGGRLARPSFPIRLSTTGPVEAVTLGGEAAGFVDLTRVGPRDWRLTPAAPLNSDLTVALEAGGSEIRRRIGLRASAMTPDWGRALPNRFVDDQDIVQAWTATSPDGLRSGPFHGSTGRPSDPPCQELLDLVERLAAKPAVMPLGGLLELLESLPGVDEAGKWNVLRAVVEGGLVDPLRVRGWRGGAVVPRAPRAVAIPTEAGLGLRMDGVLNEVFTSRLQGVAYHLGLSVTATNGVGAWSPRTVAVTGEWSNLEALVSVLGVSLEFLAVDLTGHVRPGGAPNANGANHRARHEITMAELEPLAARGIRLALCRREADDTPPVWLVDKDGVEPRYWSHRHLALLDACAIARHPPAQIEEGRLRLTMPGAFLPLQAARWLRLASGAAGGVLNGSYAYALTPPLEPVVRGFLGLPSRPAKALGSRPILRGRGIATATPWGVDVVPAWKWARHRGRVTR
jgi:hypothetical protein